MNVVVGGLMIHPLDQKPELKTIDGMFQSLDLLIDVLYSKHCFSQAFEPTSTSVN